jgi:hypothetical protein
MNYFAPPLHTQEMKRGEAIFSLLPCSPLPGHFSFASTESEGAIDLVYVLTKCSVTSSGIGWRSLLFSFFLFFVVIFVMFVQFLSMYVLL